MPVVGTWWEHTLRVDRGSDCSLTAPTGDNDVARYQSGARAGRRARPGGHRAFSAGRSRSSSARGMIGLGASASYVS